MSKENKDEEPLMNLFLFLCFEAKRGAIITIQPTIIDGKKHISFECKNTNLFGKKVYREKTVVSLDDFWDEVKDPSNVMSELIHSLEEKLIKNCVVDSKGKLINE